MADEIDSLEIQVKAQAQSASNQLDKLVKKLGLVSSALSSVNVNGLSNLAGGIRNIASASSQLSNVKTADFTRLKNNINALSNQNYKMFLTSNAITNLATSLNSIGSINQNVLQFADVANSIGKLGGVMVQKAITNIPQLTTAITNMMAALSKAPAVSKNVINTTNAVANLANQGQRLSTATKSINNGFKANAESAENVTAKFKSLAFYFGKLYANYFMFIRAFKGIGSAITSSMDYIEEYNYFNVTMGKIGAEWEDSYSQFGYESAEAYANSFTNRMNELTAKMTGFNVQSNGTLVDNGLNSLGLDVTSLMNYEAGLSQITNSLGLTGEAGISTSKALSMLAGDMSSFRNTELSTVMTNFQSGLIGQSRALYKYGIDITNATLQTYAYKLGISKSITEMTQGEKMQLRTIAILDQSKVAWGDLANTIESPSNQLRVLKNNMTTIGRTIGNIFLPAVATVLPYVNGLAIAIRRLFEYTADMLGIDISGIISNSGAGYSDAFSDIEDDTDSISSGLDDATDSAKSLKNELMGFDEINKLSDTTTSTTSNSDPEDTIDLTNQLTKALSDYETIWNASFDNMSTTAESYADKVVGVFKKLKDASKPTTDSISNLWHNGLKNFRDFSSSSLTDFYTDFLVPIGKWTLGTGIPKFVDAVNNFFVKVNWTKINANLKNFYQVLKPFTIGIGDGLLDFFYGLMSLKANLINAVNTVLGGFLKVIGLTPAKTIHSVGEALGGFIAVLVTFKALSTVYSTISKITTALGELATSIPAAPYILAAAAIAGLVLQISDLCSYEYKPTVYKLTQEVKDLHEQTQELIDDINEARTTRSDSYSNADEEYEYVDTLAQKYFELKEKQSLSNDETAVMQSYYDELSEQLPGFKEIVDNQTTSYEEQKKAVDNLITSLKKEAYAEAAKENMVEIAKQRLSLQKQLDSYSDNEIASIEAVTSTREKLRKELNDGWDAMENLQKQSEQYYDSNHNIIAGHEKDVEELQTQYDKLSEKFGKNVNSLGSVTKAYLEADNQYQVVAGDYEDIQNQLQTTDDEWNYYAGIVSGVSSETTGYTNDMANAYIDMANTTDTAVTNVQSSLSKLPKFAQDTVNSIKSVFTNNGKSFGETFVNNIKMGIDGQKNVISESLNKVFDGVKLPSLVFDTGLNTSGQGAIVLKPNLFATGGFPEDGWFRASHGEMMGQFDNGQAVVANNNQITDGIASATYRANQEEAALLRQQNQLLQKLLEKDSSIKLTHNELFNSVRDSANSYTMQTGKSAFPV